ncbi:MAG: hypothetical protein IPH65_17570 [Dehalococcoidia bacterium]|uniref:UPF0758 domain-containing protein n=1 Tax=Candidatus Amarobacter glycogenicus TaxID=3140699 RepID=UPI0031366964|nr:hypothetical protein [Dehalococcoidia bacterium]
MSNRDPEPTVRFAIRRAMSARASGCSEHGAETLSDAELLAIILRSGLAGENVVDMARRLIDNFRAWMAC